MSTVLVTPVSNGSTRAGYCAVVGDATGFGETVGQALDALLPQYDDNDASTLIVVRRPQPDDFFNEAQQSRLTDLMSKWRTARAANVPFDSADQEELESLIGEEIVASGKRAADLATRLKL